jgi:putative FmdB family regulatory protein
VFSVLSGGAITAPQGMVIGTTLVLIYVLIGGMLAVAWTDFIQMIVLVVGLSVIAGMASQQAGGADKVLALAQANDWFKILPEQTPAGWIGFIAAAVTMMFGSIPQQDVFQRVMSAKDSKTAQRGAMIGGFSYLAFAFVPMFIVAASMIIMPTEAKELLANDPQKVLPTLILTHMPLVAQIFFFGALVSAIKSTSSATLLAPSTSFVENILKNIKPGMNDKQVLLALRITIFIFTGLVLTYAIVMQGTAIYDLVSSAYQVTLVAAFVPLTLGLYWSRATTQGAIMSIAMGIGVWGSFLLYKPWGEAFPGQLAGLIAALVGMLIGCCRRPSPTIGGKWRTWPEPSHVECCFYWKTQGFAMPIYAYRCESCGHAKDVLQKMSDPVLTTCPSCGAESFKKQLTAAGFQLKGSGWYVTDFRGGASGGAAAPAASGVPAAGAASDTGSAAPAAATGTPAAAPSSSGDTGSKGGDAGSSAHSA